MRAGQEGRGAGGKRLDEGECDFWFELAFELRVPVAVLKKQVLSSEVPLYKEKMNRRWNEHTKEDYYMANIAATVARASTTGKRSRRFKTDDFLLEFKTKGAAPADPVARMNRDKAAWALFLGVPPE